MAFDRSKIKGAAISTMKASREEAEKKSWGNSGDRIGYLKIEEGVNIFRIYPPHDPKDPPYQPIRTAFLKCEVDQYSDGKKTGEKEVRNTKIFSASIHGVETIKADPIDTYIKYVYAKASSEYTNKDEKARFLNPITGFMANGKWNPGLRPSTNFIYYAEKNGELGKAEFSSTISKRMEELNIAEQYDAPIETDIFSDPNNGYSLKIIYDKKGEKGKKHNVSKVEFNPRGIPQSEIGVALQKFQESQMISDEKLEKWFELKSLADTYKNVYSMRDFNLAIDGLRRFDEEKKYGIFENEEFIEELNEIMETVPDEVEDVEVETAEEDNDHDSDDSDDSTSDNNEAAEEVPETKVAPKTRAPRAQKAVAEKVVEAPSTSSTATWSKMKCVSFVEAYVQENYGEDTVIPTLDVVQYREWAELALKGEELPFPTSEEVAENEVEAEAPVVEKEETPAPTKAKISDKRGQDFEEEAEKAIKKEAPAASVDRIAEIRARMNKGK